MNSCILPAPPTQPDLSHYSRITALLTPEQRNTLASALNIILHHRAVLLYETTGSGKTYVASALASILQAMENSECIIIAPFHLLQTWKAVASRFNIKANYYSYQAASLHSIPMPQKDDAVWLIDEAHTLKNRNTKRFAEIQKLTSRHRVCLITATPVSMGWRDLQAILTICGLPQIDFQNDTKWLQAFARAIIPQTETTPLTTETSISCQNHRLNYDTQPTKLLNLFMSELAKIQWMTINQSQTLDEIKLLPLILMHRFLSHPASCLITLKKLEKYYASAKLNNAQKMLTRKEFRRLMGIDGTQLLLPFDTYDFGNDVTPTQKNKLSNELHHIQNAIQILKKLLDAHDDKLLQIQKLIELNPQNKYIIFTQYADTAIYIANHLNATQPIALMTADRAEYNRHKLDPNIILAMFNPNIPMPTWWAKTNLKPAGILICTDAYSAGQNLQTANTLIHFELPWNPTTLRQREGRIIRKGQKSSRVDIFEMHHLNTNIQLQTYQTHLESRLKRRNKLQLNWFDNSAIQTSEFLISHASGMPYLWARCKHTWIPIHPNILKIIPDTAQIIQTTLAEAFSESIQPLRHIYQMIWNYLKLAQNTPQISKALKNITQAAYQCAIFPQLVHHNCSHFEFLYENFNQIMAYIDKLPIKSIPSPNTPCWKILLYPQIQRTFPQIIHKLSTDFVPILSP